MSHILQHRRKAFRGVYEFIQATGGTITTSGDYKIHSFTSDGTFTITDIGTDATYGDIVDFLIVAGGAGAGGSNVGSGGSGGGGAGGILFNSTANSTISNDSQAVTEQAYSIVVGDGGAGGNDGNRGDSGENSSAFGGTAIGGGGGAAIGTTPTAEAAAIGGSGGGGGGGVIQLRRGSGTCPTLARNGICGTTPTTGTRGAMPTVSGDASYSGWIDDCVDSDSDSSCDGSDACTGADWSGNSDGDVNCDDTDICPGFDDSIDSDGDTIPDGCDNTSPVVTTNTGLLGNEGDLIVIDTEVLVTDAEEGPAELVFSVTSSPTRGYLTLDMSPLTGTFTQADITSGRLGYQHGGDEYFSDSVTFEVSDGDDGLLTFTVSATLTPVSDDPVIQAFGGLTLAEAASATISNTMLRAVDVDDGSGRKGEVSIQDSGYGFSHIFRHSPFFLRHQSLVDQFIILLFDALCHVRQHDSRPQFDYLDPLSSQSVCPELAGHGQSGFGNTIFSSTHRCCVGRDGSYEHDGKSAAQ